MPVPGRLRSLAAVVAVVAAACNGDGGAAAGPEAFCERVREATPELTAVSDPAGAGATANRLASLGEQAPEAIRPEWDQLTELFRAVARLDPAAPGFRDAVLAETGKAATAAGEVNGWVQRNCGIDLTAESLAGITPTSPTSAPGAPTSTPSAPPAGSTVPVVPVPTG
jgi:hypothetical protein